ncbi:MAG: AAA family ATPase [Streptosporangiaceae bacterium]
MRKSTELYNRDAEWGDVTAFATDPRLGATLALVYGRRRQGKTLMLELLAEATGGFMFTGLQQSDRQNLDALGRAYAAHLGIPSPTRFDDWIDAIDALLRLGEDPASPTPVVLDEFPYLAAGGERLPSIIQNALSPRGRARRRSRTRLVLCGSAVTTMRTLLQGNAPLRGRAGTELFVHPFGFREAAGFWGVADSPPVAVRLHALVGGTPAYKDMCGSAPSGDASFDAWVTATLLNPSSAMFREGHVLLSEEPEISDLSVYYSVLSAISWGRTRRGEIAQALGRKETALGHVLSVLEQTGLVVRTEDALRRRRTTYLVAEPILRLHQLVIRPHESRLGRRSGSRVWREVADTVAAKIYGPHFEHLAREWCAEHASAATLAGVASEVRPAVLPCTEHREGHELDVVVTSAESGGRDTVTAVGEAKWRSTPLALGQLERLDHLRALLPSAVVRRPPKLLLFASSGFTRELRTAARSRHDVELVDLDRLYRGG